MTYSDTYRTLKDAYSELNNFEIVAEAMDNHLRDFFQLNVLNRVIDANPQGSYVHLFEKFIREFNDLHTVDEVVAKFYEVLQRPLVRDWINTHCTFVPPSDTGPSRHLGFLEKMANGQLAIGEPLTMMDLMRGLNGAEKLIRERATPPMTVVHLAHLAMMSPAEKAALFANHDAILINFNTNMKDDAKWGVLDLRDKHNPQIYCEAILLEKEKQLIEALLEQQIPEDRYLGGTSASLPSTGYSAYAWLDKEITRAWNFNVDADFSGLVKDFTFLQFGGTDQAQGRDVKYQFLSSEVDQYCSPEFVYTAKGFPTPQQLKSPVITGIQTQGEYQSYNHLSLSLYQIGELSALGEFMGSEFKSGELSLAISAAYTALSNPQLGLDKTQISAAYYRGIRTFPLKFDETIIDAGHMMEAFEHGDPNKKSIRLLVPADIHHQQNKNQLNQQHRVKCRTVGANASFFTSLQQWLPGDGRVGAHDAIVMVFTLLRARSKVRKISIELPDIYQLDPSEQMTARKILEQNVYVTEFEVGNNVSLSALKTPLKPIFARNRWLHARNYLPPVIDDYWRKAAKEWLARLGEEPNVLEPKAENDEFKRCTQEMGLQGLEAILRCLNHEVDRESIEKIYNGVKPPFYAACEPHEFREYIARLLTHLQTPDAYFPFSELGFSFQHNYVAELADVVTQLNALARQNIDTNPSVKLDKISFTECLQNPANCESFLQLLTHRAQGERWLGLIVIPELEDTTNTAEALQPLRLAYAQLNNLILHNRQTIIAQRLIDQLDTLSPSPENGVAIAQGAQAVVANAIVGNPFQNVAADHTWPLTKGGAVQLQLQQQMEVAQVRQVSQKQQTVVELTVEEAIVGRLVNYETIEALLSPFFQTFSQENPIVQSAAVQQKAGASLLQNFFHTWINANPVVDARFVIRHMTLSAAKALLRNHALLTAGLNPDNLPKGFYTARTKDGALYLGYNPSLGYVKTPNPLTLQLNARPSIPKTWEGDYRQLAQDVYLIKPYNLQLDLDDWNYIFLFSALQPKKKLPT